MYRGKLLKAGRKYQLRYSADYSNEYPVLVIARLLASSAASDVIEVPASARATTTEMMVPAAGPASLQVLLDIDKRATDDSGLLELLDDTGVVIDSFGHGGPESASWTA